MMRPLLLSIAFSFTILMASCSPSNSQALDSGFVHTVFFWLKNPDNPDDRQAFEESLLTFMSSSEHLEQYFIGKPPRATRDVVQDDFTYSITVIFKDAAAQEAYQKEAVHSKFIEESEALWERVEVYDALPVTD